MEHSIGPISHNPRSRLLWTLMVSVTMLVLVLLTIGIMMYLPVYRSRAVLSHIRQLRVGTSNFAETAHVAQALGARQISSTCTPQRCNWEVSVSNERVPAFWRGQVTELAPVLTVENNVLVEKNVYFGRGPKPRDPKVTVFEAVPTLWRTHGSVSIGTGYDPQLGKNITAFVAVSPLASAAEKEKYFNLNLNCFWKYRGCTYVHQFLPAYSDPQ